VNRKGQAAMEYLMTYGWALLVIVIVIAVLIVMNPLKPAAQCLFDQPGFACNQPSVPVITASTGMLNGKLTNGQQATIKIYNVTCTDSRTAPASPTFVAEANAVKITSEAQAELNTMFGGVKCLKGTALVGAEDFNGKLYVFYKFADDASTYPMRSVSANLVTKGQ